MPIHYPPLFHCETTMRRQLINRSRLISILSSRSLYSMYYSPCKFSSVSFWTPAAEEADNQRARLFFPTSSSTSPNRTSTTNSIATLLNETSFRNFLLNREKYISGSGNYSVVTDRWRDSQSMRHSVQF